MVAPALVAVMLAASPPPKPEPLKLAAPGLGAVNIAEKEAAFYAEHLAHHVSLKGISVITRGQLAALLGFERQKQLLGCADESASCLAELGNALGVDGLLIGELARIGKTFQANLKVVDARDASTMAAWSGRAKSEEAVLDLLETAAKELASQLDKRRRPADLANRPPEKPTDTGVSARPSDAPTTSTTAASSASSTSALAANVPATSGPAVSTIQVDTGPSRSPMRFVALGGGAVLLAGGVGALVMANARAQPLRDAARDGRYLPPEEVAGHVEAARPFEYAGWGLTAVGAVGLGLGAWMMAAPGEAEATAPRASLFTDGSSFAVSLSGGF